MTVACIGCAYLVYRIGISSLEGIPQILANVAAIGGTVVTAVLAFGMQAESFTEGLAV